MNQWLLVCILSLSGWNWVFGVTDTVYDPNIDYVPMTDLLPGRHRGGIDLPPCVKDLMNCWEVMNPDRVCGTWDTWSVVVVETMCMDMRFQCREYSGYAPFPENRSLQALFKYCKDSKLIQYFSPVLYFTKNYTTRTKTAAATTKPTG